MKKVLDLLAAKVRSEIGSSTYPCYYLLFAMDKSLRHYQSPAAIEIYPSKPISLESELIFLYIS